MKKLLTVAIPSYNAQKYLPNVVEKLLKSDVKDLLDIIIVNDGSHDDTLKIAKEYEAKFPYCIRVIDKKNGGHGSAINSGIKHAKGTFFRVLDADDWLDADGLVETIRFINTLNSIQSVDMIISPTINYNDKTHKMSVVTNIGQKPDCTPEKITDVVDLLDGIPQMNSIIYRTTMLADQFENIKIDEHHFYVDVEYTTFPFLFVSKAIYLPIPLYVYRFNETGQSTTALNLIKNKQQHLDVLRHVSNYIRVNVELNDRKYSIMERRVSQMVAAQFKIILLQKVNKNTLRELRDFNDEVNQTLVFNKKYINKPIKLLLASKFTLFPILHLLALLKSRFVAE